MRAVPTRTLSRAARSCRETGRTLYPRERAEILALQENNFPDPYETKCKESDNIRGECHEFVLTFSKRKT